MSPILPIMAATQAGSAGIAGAGMLGAMSSVMGPLTNLFGQYISNRKGYHGKDHQDQMQNELKWRQEAERRLRPWMRKQAKLDAKAMAPVERKIAKTRTQNQYKWLVEGAQRAGFNPLTLLGATGGNVANNMASIGETAPLNHSAPVARQGGNALGAGLQAVGDVLSSMDPIDMERRRLENELVEKRINQIDSEGIRFGQVPQVRRTASPIESEEWGGRPRPPIRLERPGTADRDAKGVRVWLPNGASAALDHSMARRYKIQRNDLLSAGEVAEITGELIGEGAAALQFDRILNNALQTGVFSDYEEQRENEVEEQQLQDKLNQPGMQGVNSYEGL